jgi:hypothetical protein
MDMQLLREVVNILGTTALFQLQLIALIIMRPKALEMLHMFNPR